MATEFPPTDCDDLHDADLQRDQRIRGWKDKARRARRRGKKRNLYIITLHPDVLEGIEVQEPLRSWLKSRC